MATCSSVDGKVVMDHSIGTDRCCSISQAVHTRSGSYRPALVKRSPGTTGDNRHDLSLGGGGERGKGI